MRCESASAGSNPALSAPGKDLRQFNGAGEKSSCKTGAPDLANQYLNTLPLTITSCRCSSNVALNPVREAAVVMMLAME